MLKNLAGFLPESVVPLQCSMQSAEAFTSLGYFVETLCSEITSALGYKPEVAASENELVTLSRLLASCNSRLADNEQCLLLAIDEYENIAETAIDLVNDENKTCIDSELFERTLDRAIERGEIVLYELLRRESLLPGEWEYLAGFRRQEAQPPPEDELIYQSLRRRLLVSEEKGEWRLRVPLMARWLRVRG